MAIELKAMTPVERARRFWEAHGRSTAHLAIIQAFCDNPAVEWSPAGLSVWYGIDLEEAREIVAELAACRIVRAVPDRGDRSVWDDMHDWAVPRSPEARDVLRDRWENREDRDRRRER